MTARGNHTQGRCARTVRGAGRAGRVTSSRSRGPKRTQPSTPPLAFAFASVVACGSASFPRTSSRIGRFTSGSTNTFPACGTVRPSVCCPSVSTSRQAPPRCSAQASSVSTDGRANAGADDGYDSDVADADVPASNAMLPTRPGAPHLPQAPSRVRPAVRRSPPHEHSTTRRASLNIARRAQTGGRP